MVAFVPSTGAMTLKKFVVGAIHLSRQNTGYPLCLSAAFHDYGEVFIEPAPAPLRRGDLPNSPPPEGSCEKIGGQQNLPPPHPRPLPPNGGEGKEKNRVNSLAPTGGEGGRRPGEGSPFNSFTPSGV